MAQMFGPVVPLKLWYDTAVFKEMIKKLLGGNVKLNRLYVAL